MPIGRMRHRLLCKASGGGRGHAARDALSPDISLDGASMV